MSRASKEEEGLLTQLRQRLGDVLKTKEQQSDPFLLRWLRARDLNLDNTESMILNSLKWRKENDVDAILNRNIDPWMKTNYPFWTKGRDLEGRPVVFVPIGSWDMRKALDKGLEDELIDYFNYMFETVMDVMRKINDTIANGDYPFTQFFVIVDWQNYSYAQLMHWKALQKIFKIATTYESHYPEIVFRLIFVNCPAIFPLFMAMLKPIITPQTLGKITCHSKRVEWEPLLQTFVAKDQLPSSIGGTYPSDSQTIDTDG